jgi:hypothetical protein
LLFSYSPLQFAIPISKISHYQIWDLILYDPVHRRIQQAEQPSERVVSRYSGKHIETEEANILAVV